MLGVRRRGHASAAGGRHGRERENAACRAARRTSEVARRAYLESLRTPSSRFGAACPAVPEARQSGTPASSARPAARRARGSQDLLHRQAQHPLSKAPPSADMHRCRGHAVMELADPELIAAILLNVPAERSPGQGRRKWSPKSPRIRCDDRRGDADVVAARSAWTMHAGNGFFRKSSPTRITITGEHRTTAHRSPGCSARTDSAPPCDR